MEKLSRNTDKITYIYSSMSHLGKLMLGYLKGTKKKLEVIDITEESIGDDLWLELSHNLDMTLGEIFEQGNLERADLKNTENFTTSDWATALKEHPELLQRPIAINGERAILISNRSEILQFFGVDSAGLEKKMSHEAPTTTTTTQDEDFI